MLKMTKKFEITENDKNATNGKMIKNYKNLQKMTKNAINSTKCLK
jgi:hypothetical protein